MLSLRTKQIISFSFVLVGVLAIVSWVSAAAPATVNLPNPIGGQTIEKKDVIAKVGGIISTFIGFTGTIALAMFVYGGFLWLTSGGNTEKVKKGREVFFWSVIGLLIIFNSYLLVDYVIKGMLAGASPDTSVKQSFVGECMGATAATDPTVCQSAGGVWVVR